MTEKILPESLLLTERGEEWLSNFEDQDKLIASKLVMNLTLISTLEFERKLVRKIEELSCSIVGVIGLYGARELMVGEEIFPNRSGHVDSAPRGIDIGSEGRIATIIRNLVRETPQKFLNHPSLDELKKNKCHDVLIVDDFIGSGRRVNGYLSRFYNSSTVKSWTSYRLLNYFVVAYSGTRIGKGAVERHKTGPAVMFERSCPTISSIDWRDKATASELIHLCKKYGRQAKLSYPLGYKKVGALIVFEHSCPNNCTQLLWGSGRAWKPLFYGKAISSEAKEVFPPEIVSREPISVMIAAGEHRIAKAGHNVFKKPLPHDWLAVLSLFSRSVRHIEAIEDVTRMNHSDAKALVERCISCGLVTRRLRLTEIGHRELKAARRTAPVDEKKLPKLQEEYYYPLTLRSRD